MKRLVLLASAGIALTLCMGGGDRAIAANSTTLSVSFNWCSGTPATKVSGIPVGTKTLRFRLKDHQATGYQHGGGEYPVSGKSVSIPCGGLKSKSYEGPSPPAGQVHDYEWIVTAVDASGSVVGTGSALRKFPQ
ncbi:hypothetical protein ACETRX_34530 [Labrys portucalensis]|uniref:Phospholipid-binding protein n=1 Tax=Labrys neptuniae TaxID=376174 RepID=A0ABV6ZRF7_9HYPH